MNKTLIIAAMMSLLIALSSSAQQRQWETIAAVNAPISALYINKDNTVFAGDYLGIIYTIKDRTVIKKDTLPLSGSRIFDLLVVDNKLWVANGNTMVHILDLETDAWSTLPLTGVKKFTKNDNLIVAAEAYHPNYRSIDNGKTWQQIDITGLPKSNQDLQDIISTSEGELYAAYQFWGLWKSTDSGVTWHQTGLRFAEDSLISVSRIAITQNYGIIVNAADKEGGILPTSKSGLYYSLDHGNTWKLLRRAIYNDSRGTEAVTQLASDENHLLAALGLGRSAIIESFDGGKTWEDRIQGLGADTLISVIALRGDIAIAATASSVIYQLSAVTGVAEYAQHFQHSRLLLFPNPAQNTVRISVNNPDIGNSAVFITDVLGNRSLLWEGSVQTTAQLSLNLELPQSLSGVYTITYVDDNGISTSSLLSVVQ